MAVTLGDMALSDYQKKRQELIFADRPIPEKKKKPIAKMSEKRKKKLEEQRGAGGDSEMDLFFAAQRKHMTGKCLFCGGDTMKKDDEKYHFSISHIFPKRPIDKGGFPSVATHEDNWLELCFWNNNCHGNFDNGMITWEFIKDSKEWDIVKEKLLNLLPLIPAEERKHKLYSKLENLVYGKNS